MNTATWISSLRSYFILLTLFTRKPLALLAMLAILALGSSLLHNTTLEAAQNPTPIWFVDAPILFRARAEPFDHFAVKDPTIVFSGGRYHMFYTGANASGGWQMLYSSATTLEGFRTATHTFLSRIGEGYFAAPEVFFFEPHGLWYLIYQDGTFGAAYATSTNIADPNSWSGPKALGISGNLGWDYYVICDAAFCYMYNTPSDGSRRIFMRRTALGNFPTGWSAPSVALTDTFEGLNVYRSLDDGQYYLVVEDLLDNRYYELWRSSSAGGPWTKVAEKWAWHGNLVYNADRWTTSVSHGEFIRAGINQRLEINDIDRVDFLIQGTTQLSCCPYQQIPWDLGVIRNYTSTPTPVPTPTPRPTPVPTPQPSPGTSTCSVFYVVTNQWNTGFQGDLVVTNNGPALTSWTLTWTFASPQQIISQLWNGAVTQAGANVSVRNLSYNGNVPAGGTISMGFLSSWSVSNPVPAAFKLNGVACTAR
jgi:hypothetical protein